MLKTYSDKIEDTVFGPKYFRNMISNQNFTLDGFF